MRNILFMKADKGNTIVIIYKQDYISKMMDILQDDTKFKEVHNDNTRDRFNALQGWVQRHKHIFSDNDYVNIYPSSATIPTLYGQAKIHKDGIPMKPILSMVGAYNHGLATYLGKLFSGLRDSKNICSF